MLHSWYGLDCIPGSQPYSGVPGEWAIESHISRCWPLFTILPHFIQTGVQSRRLTECQRENRFRSEAELVLLGTLNWMNRILVQHSSIHPFQWAEHLILRSSRCETICFICLSVCWGCVILKLMELQFHDFQLPVGVYHIAEGKNR